MSQRTCARKRHPQTSHHHRRAHEQHRQASHCHRQKCTQRAIPKASHGDDVADTMKKVKYLTTDLYNLLLIIFRNKCKTNRTRTNQAHTICFWLLDSPPRPPTVAAATVSAYAKLASCEAARAEAKRDHAAATRAMSASVQQLAMAVAQASQLVVQALSRRQTSPEKVL